MAVVHPLWVVSQKTSLPQQCWVKLQLLIQGVGHRAIPASVVMVGQSPDSRPQHPGVVHAMTGQSYDSGPCGSGQSSHSTTVWSKPQPGPPTGGYRAAAVLRYTRSCRSEPHLRIRGEVRAVAAQPLVTDRGQSCSLAPSIGHRA